MQTSGSRTYPIDVILPELKKTLKGSPSAVLHAPPGAGKTTRVPLALLDITPPENGRIVMLEPRRIAAASAARWMAHLLGEQVGQTVGYTIRFDRRVSDATRIEVVTEGVLTRRIQNDPGLDGVAMIIFDEFHERSMHADLALALCLDVQHNLRADLKLLVMSATLDCGPIAELLGRAPVLTATGKSFPVDERYLPPRHGTPLMAHTADTILRALRETQGDLLVFLPGAGEIRSTSERLRAQLSDSELELHPLYGDLPFADQQRAILPSRRRKIVLATNIAETSLTIEGVRVVVDSGLTRRLQHDPEIGMNRLITVSESKVSAEQRKGRAGRLGPGVCYRLYSQHTFAGMMQFAPPEVMIADLAPLVLELSVWGIRDPSRLNWLDLPPQSSWKAATEVLCALGALDIDGSPTTIGRAMAALPLHPRLARLLLHAQEIGTRHLGYDLAALLSERDILKRSAGRADICEPDIAERLHLLHRWRQDKLERTGADINALQAVDRVARQLRQISKAPAAGAPALNNYDALPRLLLSAFPDRLAKKRDDASGRFLLAQGRGVRMVATCGMSDSTYIVALVLDAGVKGDGVVHVACALTEDIVRAAHGSRIETLRRVGWDKRHQRVVATLQERIGTIVLDAKPFSASDEEAIPLLCEAIASNPNMLSFTKEALQMQGRVTLLRRCFPDEQWPDLSRQAFAAEAQKRLAPFLSRIRSAEHLKQCNLLPALKAVLSWEQKRLLDERAPAHLAVPSGHRVALDYAAGDVPVLAVKLQEMFGCADTPAVAGGRVKVLLHLLSPAGRPVQITQDLKAFWDNSYFAVRKDLRGRYPKHPWPDDPWNALPTRRVKSLP